MNKFELEAYMYKGTLNVFNTVNCFIFLGTNVHGLNLTCFGGSKSMDISFCFIKYKKNCYFLALIYDTGRSNHENEYQTDFKPFRVMIIYIVGIVVIDLHQYMTLTSNTGH